MEVVAIQAVGQLVADRLADHRRPGGKQRLDAGCRRKCRRVRLQPARIARAGDVVLNVDEIFYAEGAAGERSLRRAREGEAAVRAEGAGGVLEVRGVFHSAAWAVPRIG